MIQSDKPLVDVRSLSRHYREGIVQALNEVDLQIMRGEHVAVVGKSGCGKTTLLNLIGGLEAPSDGTIDFDGQRLGESVSRDKHRTQNVGFVFQDYFLLPHLTAGENVQLPMFQSSRSPAERTQASSELLSRVGLAARADHRPTELSGGECQRVAIARALANRPKMILADEPTGALDAESGEQILELLKELNREGTTLIVVTHDPAVASQADRQIRLVDGRCEA